MNYSELNDYQINNLVHNVIVCGGKYTLVFGEDYDIRWIDRLREMCNFVYLGGGSRRK